MKIAVLESNYVTRNHYIFVAIVAALRRHPCVDFVEVLDLRTALTSATQIVELLLVVGGEEADSVVVETLRSRASISAIWFTEDPYEHPRNVQIADRFDIVFSNDENSSKRYGGRGIHLPLAAATEGVSFVPFNQRRYDISFVATAWPNRAQLLVDLDSTLKSLKSKIILSGNQFLAPHLSAIKFRQPLGAGVDFGDFMRIATESRLSLFVDRNFTMQEKGCGVSDTPGPRFFEVGSVGCCILVDERVAGNMERFGLRAGQDYFSFYSASDCRDHIARFKKDQAPFEAAGRSLKTKILAQHLYDQRIATILRSVEKFTSRKQAITPRRRLSVLFITHNLPELSQFGGAELYLRYLVENLQDVECHIFTRDVRAGFGKSYVLTDRAGKPLQTFVLEKAPDPFTIDSPELNLILMNICRDCHIDHVFINHLLGFPPAIVALFRLIGLKYSIVLHDYFLTCDSFNLLTHQNRYCGIERPDFMFCRECTAARLGTDGESQYRRRNIYSQILRQAHVVIVNHPFSWRIIARSLGVKHRDNVCEIPPPLLIDQWSRGLESDICVDASIKDPRPLRVALIGNLFPNKGSRDFIELAMRCGELNITFEVFGKVDPELMATLSGERHVTLHGPFDHRSYPTSKLRGCDCVLFLSRWPETYCMSLSETNALGLVPIAYAIGAFTERITEQYGYLIYPSVDRAIETLRLLIDDRQVLEEKKRSIPSAPQRQQFINSYQSLFSNLPARLFELSSAAQQPDILRWFYGNEATCWTQAKKFFQETGLDTKQTVAKKPGHLFANWFQRIRAWNIPGSLSASGRRCQNEK